VEVADLNMARIRFVWQKIWQMLSEHFIRVGSHPNLNVSIFAIDSLRQLADKFLIKEEFASFNFQKDFLKPFE
jgi:brefeldin A-inhibited guanine nucleotide-exchange protein